MRIGTSLAAACLVLLVGTGAALAYMGTIADGPENSAVVEVGTNCDPDAKDDAWPVGEGSGYVRSRRMVITSAHVVWKNGQLCKGIRVGIRDEKGKMVRVIKARHVFVPEKYKELRGRVPEKLVENRWVEMFDSSMTQKEKNDRRADMSVEDIAVVIPEEDVLVSQKIADILDERLPIMTLVTRENVRSAGWTQPAIHAITSELAEIFGPPPEQAVGMGYGVYECEDPQREKCKPTDGHLRTGVARLSKQWFPQHYVGGEKEIVSILTTLGAIAPNSSTESPFNRGDSGAPVSVRVTPEYAKRLGVDAVVVAIVSRASDKVGIHTSLLQHADFLESILDSAEYQAAMAERHTLSFAAGFKRDKRGRWIHTSGAMRSSEPMADAEALEKCAKGGYTCKVVQKYQSGCGYLVQGVKAGSLTWAVGITSEEAQRRCKQGGYRCSAAIGSCLPKIVK